MSLFATSNTATFGTSSVFNSSTAAQGNTNPMKDIEVTSPPDDSISSMAFSPGSMQTTFLIAGSWDNNVCIFKAVELRGDLRYGANSSDFS